MRRLVAWCLLFALSAFVITPAWASEPVTLHGAEEDTTGSIVRFGDATNKAIRVNVVQGGGTGGTSSNFGAAFPGVGTGVGFKDVSNNMAPGLLDASGNLKINCQSGCAGAPGDATATGALNALNAAVSIAVATYNGVAVNFTAGGSLNGTVVAEGSNDGGTTWFALAVADPTSGAVSTSLASPTSGSYYAVLPGALSHVRLRVSVFTSGSTTGNLRATSIRDYAVIYGSDGSNPKPVKTASDGTVRVDPTGTTTQPISAASLPLPSGAATSAKQPALGTAGTASTDVLTVQGIASMTALKVDGSAVTQPVSGNGGTFPSTQSGTWSTRTQDGSGNALTSKSAGAERALSVAIVDASGNQLTTLGSSSTYGAAFPAAGTPIGFNDGSNMQAARVVDCDTSGGVFYCLPVNLISRTSGTPLEVGTQTNPLGIRFSDGTNWLTPSTVDTDDGTIAGGQTGVSLAADLHYCWDGANWSRCANGNGPAGSTAQRVTIADDSTGQVKLAAGSAVIGHIICDSGCSSSTAPADNSAFTAGTTPVGTVGGFYHATRDSLTDGRAGAIALNVNRAVIAQLEDASKNAIGATNNALDTNVKNINGVAPLMGSGNTGTGSLRVTIATDQPSLTNALTVAGAGTTAHDGAGASVNPLAMGGYASAAAPSDVSADTDVVRAWHLRSGAYVTQPSYAGVLQSTGNGTAGTGTPRVTIASDNTAFSVNAAQSGNWTARIVGNGGATLDAAGQNASSPANSLLMAAQFNTTPTTITSGNMSPLQMDNSGKLLVNCTGCSASTNLTQWNGNTIDTNSGNKSAGTLRVTLATDQVQLTNALKVDGSAVTQPVSGSGSFTVAQATASNLKGQMASLAAISTSGTLQSAAVANGNGSTLAVDGESSAVLTVNCSSCSGGTTVNFEGSEDASNFTPLQAIQIGTSTLATSTATSGLTYWELQVAGLQTIRARISGYSAGTVTVTGHTDPVPRIPTTLNVNASQSGTWTVQPGNTANTTAWLVQTVPGATNGATPCVLQSAASTNATNCKGSAGLLYGYDLVNTTTTIYYLRLYNAAGTPTCSSATGFIRTIPIPPAAASGQAGGITRDIAVGETYGTGIAFCLTGGGSSTDNTNAATGVYLTLHYK